MTSVIRKLRTGNICITFVNDSLYVKYAGKIYQILQDEDKQILLGNDVDANMEICGEKSSVAEVKNLLFDEMIHVKEKSIFDVHVCQQNNSELSIVFTTGQKEYVITGVELRGVDLEKTKKIISDVTEI